MLLRNIALLVLAFSLFCSTESQLRGADESNERAILFFGDSLTAGYGVDYDQSYPKVLQSLLSEQNLKWEVIPSGVSGETTAGGLRRIDWILRNPIDVFVLALGANDGLRGIDLSTTRANLIAIASRVRERYPDVHIVIAGMKMPPNLGVSYTDEFEKLYPSVAETLGATLIPFLLEGVGGDPRLNQRDGIHPNPEGHRWIAKHLLDSLKPVLLDQNS